MNKKSLGNVRRRGIYGIQKDGGLKMKMEYLSRGEVKNTLVV